MAEKTNNMKRIRTWSFPERFVRNFLFATVFLFGTVACWTQEEPPPPAAPLAPPIETQDVIHTIRVTGETLGIIAKWYTGKSENWSAIAKANPQLKPNNLKLGQNVTIPASLVSNRTSLPESEVRKMIHFSAVSLPPKQPKEKDTVLPKKEPAKPKAAESMEGDLPVGGPSPDTQIPAVPPVAIPSSPAAVTEESKAKPPVIREQILPPAGENDSNPLPAMNEALQNVKPVAEPTAVVPAPAVPPPSDKDLEREKLLDELLSK